MDTKLVEKQFESLSVGLLYACMHIFYLSIIENFSILKREIIRNISSLSFPFNHCMTQRNTLITLIGLLLIYLLIQYIPYGKIILYPITLIVTFLHEFWHAFFALITGWNVLSLDINRDGSGLATTSGWISGIILMWGYIGSAIFGNILLFLWLKGNNGTSKIVFYILGGLFFLTAIFWFSDIISFLIQIIIGTILIFLAKKITYSSAFLWFLWLASLAYIIGDFRVGPSSDIAKFSDIFIFIPEIVWMYLWLIIVGVIVSANIYFMLRNPKK